MRITLILLLVVSPLWSKRPNAVFLVSEDNSIHYLKHYGAKFGAMPNIEKMAKAGLTFDHAFSNAPVCSVARSTLATGILAPRRFSVSPKIRLGQGVKPWTALLRKAGYYCANNSKTDYNFHAAKGEAWNESSRKASWRKRPDKNALFLHAVLWR